MHTTRLSTVSMNDIPNTLRQTSTQAMQVNDGKMTTKI